MKLRKDFVTNSSSSSFIVVIFDKVPKTKEEFREVVFGDDEIGFAAEDYLEILWSNFQCSSMSKGEFFESIQRVTGGCVAFNYDAFASNTFENDEVDKDENPMKWDGDLEDLIYFLRTFELEKDFMLKALKANKEGRLFAFEFCTWDGDKEEALALGNPFQKLENRKKR